MAFASGHTHEVTMTIGAATFAAATDFTLLLTQSNFNASDHGALADAFAASPIQAEVSVDSGGSVKLSIDVLAVDTGADTFILRVGPYDTIATSDTLYWRYGSTSVSNTATAAYASHWSAFCPFGSTDNRVGTNGTAQGGLTEGGVSGGPYGSATAFDGTDDRIDLGDLSAGEGDYSYILWANVPASASDEYLFSEGDSGSTADYTSLYMTSGEKLRTFDQDRGLFLTSAASINGAWTMLSVTYDGTDGSIYIGGSSVGGPSSVSGSPAQNIATIGALGRSTYIYAQAEIAGVQVHTAGVDGDWIANEYAQTNATGLFVAGAFTSIGGGFQPAWARYANTIIQPGVAA